MPAMSTKPTDESRVITGTFARAAAPAPVRRAAPDACAEGLVSALRHLARANTLASHIADDLANDGLVAATPDGAVARNRVAASVRTLQRELALTLEDIVQGPEGE